MNKEKLNELGLDILYSIHDSIVLELKNPSHEYYTPEPKFHVPDAPDEESIKAMVMSMATQEESTLGKMVKMVKETTAKDYVLRNWSYAAD